MKKRVRDAVLITLLIILSLPASLRSEDKRPPATPSKVMVSGVKSGMISPHTDFIGTVYFAEVSDVACEVSGRIDETGVEDGARVKKGDIIIRLNSDLLEKSFRTARALYRQVLADLEKARLDLKRVEVLYRESSLAEQVYDEHRFRVKSLDGKAEALAADADRIEMEISKKMVASPFEGVVIKRKVDRGEWCQQGYTAATIARDDFMDVIVDVPETVVRHLKKGMSINIKAGGREFKGGIISIIPSGDVATRTFPVKMRLKNDVSLIEGMEAKAVLPTGDMIKTLTVHRDALTTKFGKQVVFAVVESKAVMVPVEVMGFDGLSAGIRSEGLEAGMVVVTKGNERINDGQMVEIASNTLK